MSDARRVVSGMRPTGALHLGHYHGVLKNWAALQREYDCFYFVADWHALTTHYEDPSVIGKSTWDMVVDWLAAGVDPDSCKPGRPDRESGRRGDERAWPFGARTRSHRFKP